MLAFQQFFKLWPTEVPCDSPVAFQGPFRGNCWGFVILSLCLVTIFIVIQSPERLMSNRRWSVTVQLWLTVFGSYAVFVPDNGGPINCSEPLTYRVKDALTCHLRRKAQVRGIVDLHISIIRFRHSCKCVCSLHRVQWLLGLRRINSSLIIQFNPANIRIKSATYPFYLNCRYHVAVYSHLLQHVQRSLFRRSSSCFLPLVDIVPQLSPSWANVTVPLLPAFLPSSIILPVSSIYCIRFQMRFFLSLVTVALSRAVRTLDFFPANLIMSSTSSFVKFLARTFFGLFSFPDGFLWIDLLIVVVVCCWLFADILQTVTIQSI